MLIGQVALAETNFSRLGAANALNVHTYAVLSKEGSVVEGLINTETGQRDYGGACSYTIRKSGIHTSCKLKCAPVVTPLCNDVRRYS